MLRRLISWLFFRENLTVWIVAIGQDDPALYAFLLGGVLEGSIMGIRKPKELPPCQCGLGRSMNKPKTTTEVKLVKSPLAKNCCKDRSGDGRLCGSVFVEQKKQGRRIVAQNCYPNGHSVPVRKVN